MGDRTGWLKATLLDAFVNDFIETLDEIAKDARTPGAPVNNWLTKR